MSKNKTLQQQLDAERAKSPLAGMRPGAISVAINNHSRKFDPSFQESVARANAKTREQTDWMPNNAAKNKKLAKTGKWLKATRAGAKRRSERAQWLKENDPEEYRRYMGVHDKHSAETLKQMKASGKARWSDLDARKAHSEKLKGIKKPKVKCEYCGKEMSSANLHRYGHNTGTGKCPGK